MCLLAHLHLRPAVGSGGTALPLMLPSAASCIRGVVDAVKRYGPNIAKGVEVVASTAWKGAQVVGQAVGDAVATGARALVSAGKSAASAAGGFLKRVFTFGHRRSLLADGAQQSDGASMAELAAFATALQSDLDLILAKQAAMSVAALLSSSTRLDANLTVADIDAVVNFGQLVQAQSEGDAASRLAEYRSAAAQELRAFGGPTSQAVIQQASDLELQYQRRLTDLTAVALQYKALKAQADVAGATQGNSLTVSRDGQCVLISITDVAATSGVAPEELLSYLQRTYIPQLLYARAGVVLQVGGGGIHDYSWHF